MLQFPFKCDSRTVVPNLFQDIPQILNTLTSIAPSVWQINNMYEIY